VATPTINNVAPTTGTVIAADAPLYFDVFLTAGAFARIIVTIKFPGMALQEVVYDGAAFTTPYAALSAVVATSDGTLGNGFHFAVRRSPIWPDSPTVLVYAISDTADVAAITPYSWLVASPVTTVPAPAVPVFPTGSGAGPGSCDGTMHDQAYFLDLYDRAYDPEYLRPLKVTPNSGYEIYQAFGKVFERVSLAIERFECGSFVIFAEGGEYATGTVEFYRLDASHGAVVVKAGTVVTTSRGARDFITLEDATFGALDLGPVAVAVRAVAQGWEWNVPGEVVTQRGELLPGEIDTCKRLIEEPAYGDPTIQVRQILATAGGRAPMLDGLGVDRGLPRIAGESDAAYRFRLRQLPDTISPDAMHRLIRGQLDRYGLGYQFIETWDITYQTCWDAPAGVIALNPDYNPNLFCFDDPRDPTPFCNRWLDEIEHRGAFVVVVPEMPAIRDVGLAYDDTAATPAALETTFGARAINGYDVPGTLSTAFGLQGGYDGFDLPRNAVYFGLWQALQQIKAAGVAAIVELKGQ
jgi:hypothetical protein